jgi:GNAT superfamily N-acetyltransferase
LAAFRRPRPINAADDLQQFDCGHAALDEWLRNRALRNESGGASRTFVSVDAETGRVAGYYCLAASSVRSTTASGALRRNMPDPIPVILIGRLAVEQGHHGRGLGAALLRDAIVRSVEASTIIGARAIFVAAIDDAAVRFYERFGFTPLPGVSRLLYLLVADAERTLDEVLAQRA